MTIITVLYYDPLTNVSQSINCYSIKEAKTYIINDIIYLLNKQTQFVSGLKGNFENHIANYKTFLEQNDKVYFFGEYREYPETNEYIYSYIIQNKFDLI